MEGTRLHLQTSFNSLIDRKSYRPQPEPQREPSLVQSRGLCYHIISIWLFTFSDMKTILLPTTIFGIVHVYSATSFNSGNKTALIPARGVMALIWVWINLLPFTIQNQTQAGAILEDTINKPWRPLPSGRLTSEEAKKLMYLFYVVAGLTSLLIGGYHQYLLLVSLGYWYNVLEGAGGLFSRNFINACGFVCFTSGSTEVVLGAPLSLTPGLSSWFLMIGAVVFTTVQTQDMYDQEGDASYGRRTLPLVIGDLPSRAVTAICLIFWSICCPSYWNSSIIVCTGFFVHGLAISTRLLLKRCVADDKLTFLVWNLWMVFLYVLPLLKILTI